LRADTGPVVTHNVDDGAIIISLAQISSLALSGAWVTLEEVTAISGKGTIRVDFTATGWEIQALLGAGYRICAKHFPADGQVHFLFFHGQIAPLCFLVAFKLLRLERRGAVRIARTITSADVHIDGRGNIAQMPNKTIFDIQYPASARHCVGIRQLHAARLASRQAVRLVLDANIASVCACVTVSAANNVACKPVLLVDAVHQHFLRFSNAILGCVTKRRPFWLYGALAVRTDT
jgi:hypothetical protein